MKKEIYKLIINPIFKISTFIVLLASFALVIVFGMNSKNERINVVEQGIVTTYSSVSDLEINLRRVNERISEFDESSEDYFNELKRLNYEKEMYQRLLEVYIPYDKIIDIGAISLEPSSNILSYNAKILSFMDILILFYIAIINYVVFSSDFDSGSYKYLYTEGNRKKVILKKLVLTVVLIFIMSAIISLIVSIYSLFSFYKIDYYVANFNTGSLIVFNTFGFIMLNCLSFIIFSILMCFFITGIFYIFKKTVISFTLSALYIVFMNLLLSVMPNRITDSLFLLPIYSFSFGIFWVTLLYDSMIGAVLILIGLFSFRRVDL